MKKFTDYRIILNAGATGQVATTCPECSASRKKKNAKCLSVNVEKGVWNCNHCGWVGTLQEGGKKDLEYWRKPIYLRPAPKPLAEELDASMVQWFADRAIPAEVLRRNKISLQPVWMPQVEDTVKAICFPYYRGEELINAKYRDREKNFRMEAGAERVLYGLNDINVNRVAIVEGECFPGDAEILTRNGWCRFDTYSGQDVLQVTEDCGAFVQPSAVIIKAYKGDLIRHETKGYLSVTTPKHNLVSMTRKNRQWRKFKAIDRAPSSADLIPRATFIDGPGINLAEDQIKLCIAVSADAAIRENKYRPRYAVFGFKKNRKTVRLTQILEACGISASITKIANGNDSICFHLPSWVTDRILPWEWVADATLAQRELIISELTEWDGNRVPNRNQTEFASKHIENASWVQAMCHTAGRCSSIIDRKNGHGEWFKTSLLHGKNSSSWQAIQTSTVQHDGPVYCLSVPSGMLMVRQERKVSVTGNCDKLSMEVAGIISCVSVPDGAPAVNTKNYASKFTFLDDPNVEAVEQWIIAVDNDLPGMGLEKELVRRFGAGKCKRVTWPDGCKDANEVLVKHGAAVLAGCLDNAQPYPIDGVIYLHQLSREIELLYEKGDCRGLSTGWPGFDKIYTVQAGELTVVTGIPGSGKSNWLDALIVNMARNHDWIIPIFSPENAPMTKHASRLMEKFIKEPFRPGPTQRMTPARRDEALKWVSYYFPFILPKEEEQWTLDNILDIGHSLVKRHGIQGMVIDPWNELEHARGKEFSETEYVGLCLKKIRQFARRTGVHVWLVAHPTKIYRNKEGLYPMPSMYDISGSSNFFNKPDNGIVVHRNKGEPDAPVEVHIQKVRDRNTGELGSQNFKYNRVLSDYEEFNDLRYSWSS